MKAPSPTVSVTDCLPLEKRSVKCQTDQRAVIHNPLPHAAPPGGYTRVMSHFGHLLKGLRVERGWTQDQLADAAGVSNPTIRRAEASKSCPLKGSTARVLFERLNAAAPVDPAIARAYLAAAGLTAMAAAVQESPAYRQSRAINDLIHALPDDDQRELFRSVYRLLDSIDARTLLTMVDAFAAARGVQRSGAPLMLHGRSRREGDHIVTEYAPVRPAAATSKPQQQRKAAP